MTSPNGSRSIPARILMVDDHRAGIGARKAVVEELGHEVTAVDSAEGAVKLASQALVDIVITDYKLPGMSGVDLIKSLRKTHPHLSIILLSGYTDVLGLTEVNTGADVVLQKSSNEIAHLVSAVKRLLKRKKPPASQRPPISAKPRKKA